jgi:hypothetical protein
LSDVVTPKALFMSTNIVAIDTAATKFFNQIEKMPVESVKHISRSAALHLGTMDLSKLKVKKINI